MLKTEASCAGLLHWRSHHTFKLENIMEKYFDKDFFKIFELFRTRKNFTFSKFADGEMLILQNKYIDILRKAHGEFKSDPSDASDQFYRNKLMESFVYKNPNYYVGIGCPCCIGNENFNWMKTVCGQDDDHLTWANIFVNSNNKFYHENFIPEYKNRDIVLICNHKANISRLPFSVKKDFRIGTNAWKNDYGMIEIVKNYITDNNIKNYVFLFCAGPFGNMLAHQLLDHCDENTYLDIGSTLDPLMGLGITRDYHTGVGDFSNRKCIWG